jgi:hypothetical protein
MAEYKIKGARNEWQRSAVVEATMETSLSGLSNRRSALTSRSASGLWYMKVVSISKTGYTKMNFTLI